MRIRVYRNTAVLWALAACLFFMACGKENRRSGDAPPFTLKTYAGGEYSFSPRDGKVTLLVFWATWCQPCLMEIPSLVELQEKYRSRGFHVVGINIDDPDGKKAVPIMRRFGVNYPMLIGGDDASRAFGGVNALPTSFLIGRDGKIREKIQGLLPGQLLEAKVAAEL